MALAAADGAAMSPLKGVRLPEMNNGRPTEVGRPKLKAEWPRECPGYRWLGWSGW